MSKCLSLSDPAAALSGGDTCPLRRGGLRHSAIQHDLHFVLKVATGDSNWVPGYSHTRVPFPPQEYNFNVIDFSDGVYLRPGRYTLALIVYDPILKKGNLWRKRVKVSRYGALPAGT